MDNREQLILKKGYTILKDGRLLNLENKEVGSVNNKGYKKIQVKLFDELSGIKKTKEIFIHRIQAFKKYGNKLYKTGIQVRHKDDNKTNNSYDNILLGTAKDNYHDRGLKKIRESQEIATKASIKYPPKKVEEIKKFYENNNNNQKLAMAKFNISSTGTLWYILNKR
jgi:hypothetical protein